MTAKIQNIKNIFFSNESFDPNNNKTSNLLWIFPLIVLVILLNNFLVYLILIVPLFLVYLRYGINSILITAIILLLTVTSSLGETLRLSVQIFSIGTLFLYFFYNYGLDFSKYPNLPKSIIFFFLFYYLSILISFLFSEFQQAGLVYIGRITLFFIIAYFVYSILSNDSSIKVLLSSLFIVASIISLSIFYELALNNFSFLDFEINMYFRSGGLIPNVNAAAGLFAIIYPIGVTILFSDYDKKTKNIIKIFLIIISIGIILSNSRAAYLSLFLSFAYIFFVFKRRYFKILVTTSAFIVLLFIIIPPLNDFITLFLRVQDGLSYREYLWQLTFDIIENNLFFGVGPGAFGQVMFKYFPVMLDSWQGTVFANLFEVTSAGNVSHNFYLGFFAELGIAGLFVSILLPVTFLRIGFKTVKNFSDTKSIYYFLAIGITSVGLGLFARANLDNVSIITNGYITTDLPFWIVFSILIFLFRKSKDRSLVNNQV